MFITEITATAGVTFNHPLKVLSKFRPEVSIKAAIMPNEDAAQACIRLQTYADKAVELQRQAILDRVYREHEIEMNEECVESCAREIASLKSSGANEETIANVEKTRAEHLAKLRSLRGDDPVGPAIEKLPEQPA